MRTIGELLTILHGCYKTIHINTLAVFDERAWVNVVTTINFSMEDHKEEVVSHPEGELVIVKAILPYDKLQDLKEWFKEGRLKFIADDIILSQNLDMDQLTCNLDRYVLPNWPAFHYENSVGNFKPEMSNKIKNQCAKFGYSDLRRLAKYELSVTESCLERVSQSQSRFIEINIPVYAKIGKDSVKLTRDGIDITVAHHGDIKSLNLHAEYISTQNRGLFFKTRSVPPSKEIMTDYTTKIDYIDDPRIESIILILMDKELGQIHDEYIIMRDLIVKSDMIIPPLFSALSIFLSKDKLKQTLLLPGSDAKKNNRPQDIFEETVCKFLSLAGFMSVRLNDNEEIRDASGNVIGSADVLAYDNNKGTLFVISCKTSMPDRNSVDRIKTTSKEIESKLPPTISKLINITPFIFTSQIAPAQKEEAQKYDVIVIDKLNLEELFGLAQTRQLTTNDLVK